MGDNPETVALLHFLASQGIDTTKLVTEHLMKYGSRVRIAQTDEGTIIGCLVFDNETDQSELRGMTAEEVKQKVGPFIYMQLLIVAPEHAMDSSKRWKERLLASFLECVTKNGKIAIIRADADNLKDIQLYRSCGFFTMEDMGIPSYSSVKGNMEILAYTPMGLEDTSQLFKKFYDMGARF
jgi:ribosomal protein S18 acetylase RimI-like enzyme